MTTKHQQATVTSPPSWLLALALSSPVILLPCLSFYQWPIVLLAVLGFFMLIGLLRQRRTFNAEDKVLQVLPRCILFVLLPMLLSSVDAVSPIQTLTASAWYAVYGLMALAVAVLLRANVAFKQLLIVLSVLICLCAFNGVAQIAVGLDMFNNPLVDKLGYANSFFASSEDYGFYLGALAAVPLYTLYLLGANRLTHLLVATLLMLGVLFGGVRSGWLMFAWALLPYIYLVYVKPAKRPVVPLIVIPSFFGALIAFVVSSSPLLQQQLNHTQGVLSGDVEQMTSLTRDYVQLWQNTGEIAEQHLVNGVGVGNFLGAFIPYLAPNAPIPTHIDILHPHHVWLDVVVNTGLIGLLALLLAYAAMWRLWRTATPEQQKLALPLLMPLVVLWWPINAHHGFYQAPLAALTLFCLAFSIAALTYRSGIK